MARPGSKLGTSRDAAAEIVGTLAAAGHTAYFAGGCVRDELLGLTPEDYDVATDATPDRVRALFPRSQEVGAAFGVMLVRWPSAGDGRQRGDAGVTVEVATFRSDGEYSDRRRPDAVHFSTPEADARRRDFTINAMFLDPLAKGEQGAPRGRVIDFVGGLADLKAGLLRAVGDPEKRLAEDHLRALRAVRFASRFGFQVDPGTADAIRRHASDLAGVSRERIGDEARRFLTHPTRAHAARLLDELGLDAPALLEPARGSGDYPALAALGRVIPTPAFHTCLAAVAVDRGWAFDHDRAADVASRWRSALCLSNEERDGLVGVLGTAANVRRAWTGLGLAAQKRIAGSPWFADAVALLEAVDPATTGPIRARVEELAATPSGIAPRPLLAGDDLIGLGLKPGPRFKVLLDAIYDAQLEGRVTDLEGARELVRRWGV